MSTHTHRRGPASIFLVHFFGRGLLEEGRTYAEERLVGLSNGDICRRVVEPTTPKKARGQAKPEVAKRRAPRRNLAHLPKDLERIEHLIERDST